MLPLPQTVTTALTLSISAVTGEATLDAELRYDPNDPFAVSLVIGAELSEPVVWVFARELLADGITAATGEGDITVEPADEPSLRQLRITLATDCLATMLAPRDRVVEFLIESFTLVPTGSELDRVDVDAEIAALLS